MDSISFKDVLKNYDDEFLLGAYKEYRWLRETGVFPPGQKYFRELCDRRHVLYGDRSIDNAGKHLLDEIARRWTLSIEG